jgi:hypothetical protein
MGCLLFDDHAFYRYLAKLLEGTVIIPLWKSVAWICLTHCKGLGSASLCAVKVSFRFIFHCHICDTFNFRILRFLLSASFQLIP